MGVLTNGGGTGGINELRFLSIVLSNSGGFNRLDAITTPPPYDGSGVTSTFLGSTATMFGVADVCEDGDTAVVPYIKNFNVEVARFDGNTWSTQTIPDTITNNFTTTDCGRTPDGIYITAQDFNDSEVEIFRSIDGGISYPFHGRISDVVGPFSGAVRDQLVTDPNGNAAAIMSQRANGQIRVTSFDTSLPFPIAPQQTDIILLAPPSGSFTFVPESTGTQRQSTWVFFAYNADAMLRTIDFDTANPAGFVTTNQGPVDSSATHYTFQGIAAIHVPGEQPSVNLAAGDFRHRADSGGVFIVDPVYPLDGVGGPGDGCVATFPGEGQKTFFTGPDPTGQHTRLYTRTELPPPIFRDGFESSLDTRPWSCNGGL